MEAKETEVACPCCQTRIWVDLRTGKVVRSAAPGSLESSGERKVQEQDWDQALGKVKHRQQSGEGKLDQALDKEKSKVQDLDELFRQAGKRIRRDGEDG